MPTQNKIINNIYLFASLILALFSAWIIQTKTYLMVADDFPFLKSLQQRGIIDIVSSAYQVTGIRRSFAFLSNIPILGLPPMLIGTFCLMLHIICTLLLFQVIKFLTQSRLLGFISAILFGVFPFGYGAVSWASGSYIITHFIFFLLAFWIILEHAINHRYSNLSVSVISGILLFLSCLIGEHLVLSVPFVGVCALAASGENIKLSSLKKSWVITPVIVFLAYIFLVLLTQSAGLSLTDIRGNPNMTATINVLTVFSVWFYQIRNFDVFQPWLSPNIFNIVFDEIGLFRIFLSLILLLLSIYFYLRKSKIFLSTDKLIYEKNDDINSKNSKLLNRVSVIIIILLMMMGLSSVHAVAGGYSASSRHQYIPVGMSLILLSIIVEFSGVLQTKLLFTFTKYFALFLIVLGVTTTWLVSSINYFELERYHQAFNALSENMDKLKMPIKIDYHPPLYVFWPNMGRTLSHSFDQEWVINLPLQFINPENPNPISLYQADPRQIVELTYERNKLVDFQIKSPETKKETNQ